MLTTVILIPAREEGRVVIAVLHRFRIFAGLAGQIPRGSCGFTIIMVLALLSRKMGPDIQRYLTFKAIFTKKLNTHFLDIFRTLISRAEFS